MADIDSMIPGIARFEEEFAGDEGLYVVLIAEAIDAAFVSKFV